MSCKRGPDGEELAHAWWGWQRVVRRRAFVHSGIASLRSLQAFNPEEVPMPSAILCVVPLVHGRTGSFVFILQRTYCVLRPQARARQHSLVAFFA